MHLNSSARHTTRAALLLMPLLILQGCATTTGSAGTDVVACSTFEPIRTRALELLNDPAELDRILAANADRAAQIADATLAKVYDRVGFLPRA